MAHTRMTGASGGPRAEQMGHGRMQHEGHFKDSRRTVFAELPGDLLGYYDHATGSVFVDRRMAEAKKRCTLVHERIHRMFGHAPLGSEPEHVAREIATERAAGRELIPFPSLLGALCRHLGDLDAVALELLVDLETLLARLWDLEPVEQTVLEACGRHCIGYGVEAAWRPAPASSLGSRSVPSVVA